jgi:hypothetical protein
MHPLVNQSGPDFEGKSLRVFFFSVPRAGNDPTVAANDAPGATAAADLIAAFLIGNAQSGKPAQSAHEAHDFCPRKQGKA